MDEFLLLSDVLSNILQGFSETQTSNFLHVEVGYLNQNKIAASSACFAPGLCVGVA